MTAKEQAQCAAIYMSDSPEDEPILWRYQFKEYEFKEFCEELCKEQREIILTEIEIAPKDEMQTLEGVLMVIGNSKYPEL